jgi:amino acid permease
MTMITGAALLSISIALNAVSSHAVCTVVFVVVGAIAVFSLASIQTLAHLSYLGWIGLASIMGASTSPTLLLPPFTDVCSSPLLSLPYLVSTVMTLTVAVSLTRPSHAPAVGPWSTNLKIIGNPSFSDASAAMATVVFAFGGTPSYFTIISEMRDVRHYTKAMLTCQGAVTAVYIVRSFPTTKEKEELCSKGTRMSSCRCSG